MIILIVNYESILIISISKLISPPCSTHTKSNVLVFYSRLVTRTLKVKLYFEL